MLGNGDGEPNCLIGYSFIHSFWTFVGCYQSHKPPNDYTHFRFFCLYIKWPFLFCLVFLIDAVHQATKSTYSLTCLWYIHHFLNNKKIIERGSKTHHGDNSHSSYRFLLITSKINEYLELATLSFLLIFIWCSDRNVILEVILKNYCFPYLSWLCSLMANQLNFYNRI